VDYLCYISRSKVDSLSAELSPVEYSDVTEQLTSENTRGGSLSAKLGKAAAVVEGGLTFGRKDTIQLERKVKTTYVAKLREVLLAIAADHDQIPDIEDLLRGGDVGDQIYYYVEARFTVAGSPRLLAEADVVELLAEVAGKRLHLSCSFRYFSEAYGDQYLIHSGNELFFRGVVGLRLGGVFILLDRQGDDIYGTPLYLKLTLDSRSHIAL
jgi:hypothetical protein